MQRNTTCWMAALFLTMGTAAAEANDKFSAAGYPSIQAAIDANPGRMIYVPPGDYSITEKIRIGIDGAGLHGPGRIIQTNPGDAFIIIQKAKGVQIRDLTLFRPEGKQDTNHEAIRAIECERVLFDNLQVIDNRTRSAAVALDQCKWSQIRNCFVQNYQRLTIDDRTASKNYGYAFNCIDGTGVRVVGCQATLVQGNRIVESNMAPTPEMKERHELGKVVKRNAEPGLLMSKEAWARESVDNWHQGSAIIISQPTASDSTQLIGNYIENAAQGVDIHADHVIMAQNIIVDSFIGMKAMHGSRNVLITGNQFIRNDLWAIGLMPGAASQAATSGDPQSANVDGGSIIANNIVSDFGYGRSNWIWGNNRAPFKFDVGQEPDDPPLNDVVVTGNVLYGSSREQFDDSGKPASSRYRFAVLLPTGRNAPQRIKFSSNLFSPGTDGIGSSELPE